MLCNFIEIALWHGSSPVNLLHIFRTPFLNDTSEWLLLHCHRLFSTNQTHSLQNLDLTA